MWQCDNVLAPRGSRGDATALRVYRAEYAEVAEFSKFTGFTELWLSKCDSMLLTTATKCCYGRHSGEGQNLIKVILVYQYRFPPTRWGPE